MARRTSGIRGRQVYRDLLDCFMYAVIFGGISMLLFLSCQELLR